MLFALCALNLYSLEVSINGAKEGFESFSTLHIRDENQFLCEEFKNDFKVTTKIVCAFSKKPTSEFKNLQNAFFSIKTENKKNTFFIVIEPFYKMKLMPMLFDLRREGTTFSAPVTMAKHWLIIGYKEKIPYQKDESYSDASIDFPFTMKRHMLPYVGSLDIKGNPVNIKRATDVTSYLKIKKLYSEKQYPQCMDLINEVMQEFPNSLFSAELFYYKLRVFAKLDDYDNVIEMSKTYLREFSSDENVPEVLALTAQAYSKVGLSTDADYFFDRLFNEHADSEQSNWGYIYKADMLEASGDTDKAKNFYKKALEETNDIDIAAAAAYKIAYLQYTYENYKESSEYIMKIVQAKPSYFMEEFKNSMEMMYAFAKNEEYLTAAALAKTLLDAMKSDHDEYEQLLRDRGLWLSKSESKKEALAVLNEYIKKYPYGSYIDEIKTAKDALFFDTNDVNVTERLKEYDLLISEYENDTIGERALYEKSKLLLSEKRYSDVLAVRDLILALDPEKYIDTDRIVHEAALGSMERSLQEKNCKEVLATSNEYNISLSEKWDDALFDCAMMGGDFVLSKRLCERNIKSPAIEDRKKWLYRYAKVDFATGNYSDVIDAAKDLILLLDEPKKSEYRDIYRYLFDAHERLGKSVDLLKNIAKIEEIYGLDYRDIERYIAVMSYGFKSKDDNLIITYGSKVMQIQKSSNSHAQSPYVEFALYQAYMNKEELQSALEAIRSLDVAELNKSDRTRQKYLLGVVLSKLWRDEEAKEAFEASIEADPSSEWAKLAKDAKAL